MVLAIRLDCLESRSMPNHAGPIRLAGGRSWFSIPGLSAIYALFEPDGAQSQERFTQAATDDDHDGCWKAREDSRSEEHTSELQSLMRISYAVFCLKKKTINSQNQDTQTNEQKTHKIKKK